MHGLRICSRQTNTDRQLVSYCKDYFPLYANGRNHNDCKFYFVLRKKQHVQRLPALYVAIIVTLTSIASKNSLNLELGTH